MKKKLGYLLVLMCVLVACHPEQSAKQELEQFTNRVVTKSATWTRADWDDAVLYYNEIYATVNQYEYAPEQRVEIDSMIVICQEYLRNRAKQTRSESADVEHRIHR